MPAVEPGRCGEHWDDCPRLAAGDRFDFACAGCGDCCRQRRDLVLSGYDLYRIARRLGLPPHCGGCFLQKLPCPANAAARPAPDARPQKTGNCPFFEGSACTIHAARPLACALYPLGQSIDPVTAEMEYYVQTPLCGARAEGGRVLQDYLQDSAVLDRAGVDARWAMVCTQLSQQAAGSTDNHPLLRRCKAYGAGPLLRLRARRRLSTRSFVKTYEILMPLLDRML